MDSFGGFLNERFMVCPIQGAFTSVAIRGQWLGMPAAMALHYFDNFPVYLKQVNAFGWGESGWTLLVGTWVVLYFFAMLAVLCRLQVGNWNLGRLIFGQATCPDCGIMYDRPLLSLNLGSKRYERCPGCKKWHLLCRLTSWLQKRGVAVPVLPFDAF